MLNRVILMGRITHDLELRQTPNGVSVLSFSLAVERSFARQGEERQTDFIDCVAWRQQAEFISRYFSKGRMIAIEGQIQTRTFQDKNGNNRKAVEVLVDSVSFTGEPKQQGGGSNYAGNYGSQNQGGYQQGGQQSAPAPQNNNAAPSNDALSIGDLGDFEEVLSDDGVPF